MTSTTRAPELPGYQLLRTLGRGGFAEVYLYQQDLPRRQVAVKVLLEDIVTDQVRAAFNAEANLMAQLSTHPSIVAIYHADIAADGRPYLVMEYCPRPNLAIRYRTERISVPEALRTGVRLAGAVETAHRMGILHRDIKPANVLTTEYGWPKLTDFGIATATSGVVQSDGAGMSVPWAPPELFEDAAPAVASADIYSLGATIYTLLAGRSPYEVPGGANGTLDLMGRIERQALPVLSRDDAPESLTAVFARAMAKRSVDRFPSAMALARALQQVEVEMRLPATAIDVLEAQPDQEASEPGDDNRTRVRGVQVIDAQGTAEPRVQPPVREPVQEPAQSPRPGSATPPGLAAGLAPPAAPGLPGRVNLGVGAVAPEHTVMRPKVAEAPVEAPEPVRSRKVMYVAGGVVAVAVVGIAAAALVFGGSGSTPDKPTDPETTGSAVQSRTVPNLVNLQGSRKGSTVTFSWRNPAPQKGDSYLWQEVLIGGNTALNHVDKTQAVLKKVPAGRTCVEVSLLRSNGRTSSPVTGCVAS